MSTILQISFGSEGVKLGEQLTITKNYGEDYARINDTFSVIANISSTLNLVAITTINGTLVENPTCERSHDVTSVTLNYTTNGTFVTIKISAQVSAKPFKLAKIIINYKLKGLIRETDRGTWLLVHDMKSTLAPEVVVRIQKPPSYYFQSIRFESALPMPTSAQELGEYYTLTWSVPTFTSGNTTLTHIEFEYSEQFDLPTFELWVVPIVISFISFPILKRIYSRIAHKLHKKTGQETNPEKY